MSIDNTLTDEQLRTLRTAVDEGYFGVPRRITLSELSDQLDESDVETSRTLRRSLDTHLRRALHECSSP